MVTLRHDAGVDDQEAALMQDQRERGAQKRQPQQALLDSGRRVNDDLPAVSNEEGSHLL